MAKLVVYYEVDLDPTLCDPEEVADELCPTEATFGAKIEVTAAHWEA